MNAYQAGSHIIASLESTQQHLLSDYKRSIGDHSVMIPVSSLSSGVYMVSMYDKAQSVQNFKLTS